MSIELKVNEVVKVFHDIERDIESFCINTGLKCREFCCKCCEKEDVEASVIEMLPLAFHLFREGTADEWLAKAQIPNNKPVCPFLCPDPVNEIGFCPFYEFRPLICRLFGFAAITDKNNQPILVTCDPNKRETPEIYHKTIEAIEKGLPVPLMKNYYFRIMGIDMRLSQHRYKLNTALRLAIEEVQFYYQYR